MTRHTIDLPDETRQAVMDYLATISGGGNFHYQTVAALRQQLADLILDPVIRYFEHPPTDPGKAADMAHWQSGPLSDLTDDEWEAFQEAITPPPDPFEQMADTGWRVELLERWAPEFGGGWVASLGRHNHPDGPGTQGWGLTPAAAVADALEAVARIENGEAKQ